MSHFEQLVGAFRMCVYIVLAAFESKDCNATDQALHDAHDLLMQISDAIEQGEHATGERVSTSILAQLEQDEREPDYVFFDEDTECDEYDEGEPDYDWPQDEYPDW